MLIKGPRFQSPEPTRLKIIMGNHEIEQTDNYKYLGIIFDDKNSWKNQIDSMCSKLSNVCGVLSKV